MFSSELQLTGLVNLDEWQKIQDSFSEVLDLTIRTISLKGDSLTHISHPSRLCTEILPKVPACKKLCDLCLLKNKHKNFELNTKRETNVKCPLGLDAFSVPITAVGDRTVSFIILGPVILKARKSISEYTKDAERYGIRLEELMDGLIEIDVFTYNRMQNIISLVRNIFSYMAQTGYHKKRLGEIAPEVVETDPLFSRYYEEKILSSLLNSCVLALGADSGSVMTLDKKSKALHIKVASKLDEKIISSTEIKMGEGIAGIVAQTAKSIILPKDQDIKGLSSKMRRKDITASMIVPLAPFPADKAQDVYGVINLNMVRKNVDFSEKDIALVKELVRMASIALIPFKQE